jgi:hypothetical protein
MKLQELDSKTTAQHSAKILEDYFGHQGSFDRLTTNQAHSMLKRVRHLIREHRSTADFHRSEQNPAYLKLIVMERGLEHRIKESQPGAAPGMAMAQQDPRQAAAAAQADAKAMTGGIRKAASATGTQANPLARAVAQAAQGKTLDQTQKKAMAGFAAGIGAAMKDPQQATRLQQMLKQATASAMESKKSRRLREASEIQQAQVVLAAQDMVDQTQKMIEQVSAMQFKDLPALVDSIRNDVGMDQAQQFNNDVTAALQGLIQGLQGSKTQLEAAQGVLTGQAPVVPGQDAGAAGAAPLPAGDVSNTADAETPDLSIDANLDVDAEELPAKALGRERR